MDELPVSVPILLLKNGSSGVIDPYTTHFASHPPSPVFIYETHYVPVLEHTFDIEPILKAFSHLHNINDFSDEHASTTFPYGGFIFTSQRAVEAFASALEHFTSPRSHGSFTVASLAQQRLYKLALPLYAVGPATAHSLASIQTQYLPSCSIRGGSEAGTGEALAHLILKGYNTLHNGHDNKDNKPPLVFLTGAKHRDIIPLTLTSAPLDQRISVEETVVYATTESASLPSSLTTILARTETAPIRWIVIFSPSGGGAVLRALGWLDETSGIAHSPENSCWGRDRKTYVVSIGPTTREYMKKTFTFDVDVCARVPSPEGVRAAIGGFMKRMELRTDV
ncbi:MAG: hypothetical protein Q9220_002051 [cf. Caloplaca sp. 1 TL-2023]